MLKEVILPPAIKIKKCVNCKDEHPITSFPKARINAKGQRTYKALCFPCTRIYHREYYHKHKGPRKRSGRPTTTWINPYDHVVEVDENFNIIKHHTDCPL